MHFSYRQSKQSKCPKVFCLMQVTIKIKNNDNGLELLNN